MWIGQVGAVSRISQILGEQIHAMPEEPGVGNGVKWGRGLAILCGLHIRVQSHEVKRMAGRTAKLGVLLKARP